MVMRQLNFFDLGITLFCVVVGFFSLSTAVGLWRVRNGGTLLRAVVVKLVAFMLWTVEVSVSALYLWRNAVPVSSVAQGVTNLDRLTLAVPMAVLLIWVVPSVTNEARHNKGDKT